MCRILALLAKKTYFKEIFSRNYYIFFNKNNNFPDIFLKIGMYTVYVYPDVVLKFHKYISTSYEGIDEIVAWSFLKFVINLINDHLLWNRGKILTPTIAFTLTTEYVQVMEGKQNVSNYFFLDFRCHNLCTG